MYFFHFPGKGNDKIYGISVVGDQYNARHKRGILNFFAFFSLRNFKINAIKYTVFAVHLLLSFSKTIFAAAVCDTFFFKKKHENTRIL